MFIRAIALLLAVALSLQHYAAYPQSIAEIYTHAHVGLMLPSGQSSEHDSPATRQPFGNGSQPSGQSFGAGPLAFGESSGDGSRSSLPSSGPYRIPMTGAESASGPHTEYDRVYGAAVVSGSQGSTSSAGPGVAQGQTSATGYGNSGEMAPGQPGSAVASNASSAPGQTGDPAAASYTAQEQTQAAIPTFTLSNDGTQSAVLQSAPTSGAQSAGPQSVPASGAQSAGPQSASTSGTQDAAAQSTDMAEPIYQAPSAQGSSTAATAIQGASTAATAYKSPIDFSGLRARNPDVIGWIKIEGTRINYPIVQGTDNAKYLYTGADGAASTSGAVFLDYESDPGFDGYNNIIYAHNMKSGAMFHDLVQFKDKNFFNAHPYITIYTPTRTLRLKVISCYYAKAEAIYRKTKFTGTADFLSYMDQMISPCAFAEKPPVQVDSLYTLITCSYEFTDARTFLYAVEVDGSGNVVPAKQ